VFLVDLGLCPEEGFGGLVVGGDESVDMPVEAFDCGSGRAPKRPANRRVAAQSAPISTIRAFKRVRCSFLLDRAKPSSAACFSSVKTIAVASPTLLLMQA
jgi:hypothetical protein